MTKRRQDYEFMDELFDDLSRNLETAAVILNPSTNETAKFPNGIDILKMKPCIVPAQWYIDYSADINENEERQDGEDNNQVTFDGLVSRMSLLQRELSAVEASCTSEQSGHECDVFEAGFDARNAEHSRHERTEVSEAPDEEKVNERIDDNVKFRKRSSSDGADVDENETVNNNIRAKSRVSICVDGSSDVDKHRLRRNGLNLITDIDDLDLLQQNHKDKQHRKSNCLRGAHSLESLKLEKQKGGLIGRIRYLRSPRNMQMVGEETGYEGISVMKDSARMVSRTIGMYVDEKGDLIRRVEIHKKPDECLGFFIRFGNGIDRDDGIFVSRVKLGSLVDENGLLLSGDEIIKVNGTGVINATLEEVISVMQREETLNIETRSQSPLLFDAPPVNCGNKSKVAYSRNHSSTEYSVTRLRTKTAPFLDLLMENEVLDSHKETKVVKAARQKPDVVDDTDDDASESSDSDESTRSYDNDTVTYRSDSISTNVDLFKSFTGKLVVDVHCVCGVRTTERHLYYCTIEINKEFKARTQSRHAAGSLLKLDDKFDLDIQHAKILTVRLHQQHTILSDKCASSSSVVLEKLLGDDNHKKVQLTATKENVQTCLSVKFTEARIHLMRRQSRRTTGVFGFNLSHTLVTEKNTIPILVRKCVAEIEGRGLSAEGIYRISGNARKKKELRKNFEANSNTTDISDASIDCHVISGILKDYLRELPKPLISQEMYRRIREKQQVNCDQNAQRKMLASIIKMAPPVNKATLIFVIEHLHRVAEHVERNKMDYKNLAVCFGPVMMSPPIEEMKDFRKYIDALEFLLTIWPSESKQNMI